MKERFDAYEVMKEGVEICDDGILQNTMYLIT